MTRHSFLFYTLHLLILPLHPIPIQALASSSNPPTSQTSSPPSCPSPTNFANTLIRPPLPSSPTLQLHPTFLNSHLLFYITSTNTSLPQAEFATTCLSHCVHYQSNPHAGPIPSSSSAHPSYVSNRTGLCLSFTVDMGKPYPPTTNDTGLYWYCEGFDRRLAEDLSDYEGVEAEGSYMHALGVNRNCSGSYRAY